MTTFIVIFQAVIVFIVSIFVIYFRSYSKEFARQKAQLKTIEDKTDIIEQTKQKYLLELEHIRHNLQKINSNYQINFSELTKRRYECIESLYMNLFELKEYIFYNMFLPAEEFDYNKKIENYKILNDKAYKSYVKCSLYISDDLKEKVASFFNLAYSTYSSFKNYCVTDFQLNNIPISSITNNEDQKRINSLRNVNSKYFERLDEQIERLPILLKEIEIEFKNNIFFKNIDD